MSRPLDPSVPAGQRRVISLGECMVELARNPDGRFGLAFGGDTFNAAVYLARGLAPEGPFRVAYATALGDDPYSDGIVAAGTEEGLDMSLARREPGRMPGLYLIETTDQGERSFWYWRDRAPAREALEGAAGEAVCEALTGAALVYFSGVTLSLYSPAGLDRLAAALATARARGAHIAMDNNYRPRGWGGDAGRARDVFARFWSLATIALPTLDDEQALWGDASAEAAARRIAAHGVGEVVVKDGPGGATIRVGGEVTHVACPSRVAPVDTTAAGDSFSGSYLAARLAGAGPRAAAIQGHRIAAVVIAHRGAIVPRAATDAVAALSP